MSPSPLSREQTKAYAASLSVDDRALVLGFLKGTLDVSSLTITQFKRINAMLVDLGLAEAEPSQTDAERVEMYRQYGLEVGVPAGRAEFSDSMMSAPFDGVPYCVDEHNWLVLHGSDRKVRRAIHHRQGMIERYHPRIKAVYDYCTGLRKGDIWVLAGGGLQLQAFFGCSEGYLAILGLGWEDESEPWESCDLQPQFEHNEPLFADFVHPGIQLSFFPR